MENWKDIPWANGEYSVSDKGRIKTNSTGRILKQYTDQRGYKRVALFKFDRFKRFKVHRIVAQTFIPNFGR